MERPTLLSSSGRGSCGGNVKSGVPRAGNEMDITASSAFNNCVTSARRRSILHSTTLKHANKPEKKQD